MTKEEKEKMMVEQRKVKALEKIANSMEAFTLWFEEIDKKEWSDRIQYYMNEFYTFEKNKQDKSLEPGKGLLTDEEKQ